jgi:hypothetical protein
MAALDIDQYIGIHEIHQLPPLLFFRLAPQSAGVRLAIEDICSGTYKPFGLPIRQQFDAAPWS